MLARSIFGVDLNPTAVWLCELRLWLSVVIESDENDPMRVPTLPNLDRNIRTGDALVGSPFATDPSVMVGGPRVVVLRQRYVRASGTRKQNLARSLDREERCRVLSQTDREIRYAQFARGELLAAQRARDLFGQRAPTSPDAKREIKRLRELLGAARKERRRITAAGFLA